MTGAAKPPFDPHGVLAELQRKRVDFVLVGALARVIQGSDEVTHGVDLVPSLRPRNVERLELALRALEAISDDLPSLGEAVADPQRHPIVRLEGPKGGIGVVVRPAGTRGYEDLRRKAMLVHLGQGLRAQVAGAGDLVRMLEALGDPTRESTLASMRRVVELDRGLALEI